MQPVLQHKCGYALVGQRLRYFPPFVAHRQPPEAAAGRNDNSRAIGGAFL